MGRRRILILVGIFTLLIGFGCKKEVNNRIELGDYLIVSSKYSDSDYVNIQSFDSGGYTVKKERIFSGGSWESEYIDDKILIEGGKELLIIDVVDSDVISISAEKSIDYASLYNETLVFAVNKGKGPYSNKYVCDICKVDLDRFIKDSSGSNVECKTLYYVPYDVSIYDELIVLTVKEFGELQEYLLYLNNDLEITNILAIPTSGAYILSNSQDLILYDGGDYYFPSKNQKVKSITGNNTFSFVNQFGDYYLRTNYIMPGTEIYLERILDGTKLESKLLLSSTNNKKTIVSVGVAPVISIQEISSLGNFIKFYNVETKEYHDFIYQIAAGEEIIGAYYLGTQ